MGLSHYDILQISRDADAKTIKAAYRKLTLQYHPDRNKQSGALQKFRQIKLAYETLIHPDKKRQYDTVLFSTSKTDFKDAFFYKKAFHSIKIGISQRVVTTEDIFEVLVRTAIPSENIELRGLQHFSMVSPPEFFKERLSENNRRPMTQVKYMLKAKTIGYIALGPACVTVGNIRYESDVAFIKVKEPGTMPFIRQTTKGEQIMYGVIIGIFALIFAAMIYNIATRGIMPDDYLIDRVMADRSHLPDSLFYNVLPTGTSPYDYYYPYKAYDENQYNLLLIHNDKNSDALILLISAVSHQPVRNHYIGRAESYTISHIPDGDYYLKVMFGIDWNGSKKSFNTELRGGFNYHSRFKVFDQPEQRLLLKQKVINDSIHPSKYEITLFPVKDGNAKGSEVNANEFL